MIKATSSLEEEYCVSKNVAFFSHKKKKNQKLLKKNGNNSRTFARKKCPKATEKFHLPQSLIVQIFISIPISLISYFYSVITQYFH